MTTTPLSLDLHQIPTLLRGEAESIHGWVQRCEARRVLLYVFVIVLGSGLFGAAIGCWRAPLQALYTAIKFPLIILLTALGNALLNGMLAPLLGLNINFRQSLTAILMSFTIAAAVLGSFSPLVLFLVWNTPTIADRADISFTSHSIILLSQVSIIAFAGIATNLRLIQMLRRLSGSRAVAWRILLGWLAGNLLLGSQLSWNFRPFVGSPGLPVQFFRDDALNGNFFEAVFRAIRQLFFT